MSAKETVKSSSGKLKAFFSGAGRSITQKIQSKTGNFVLVIVVILLINIVGSFLYARLDLTLDDSFSLSRASKDVVKALEEPLTVKVFFSKDLPAPYNGVSRYVQDLMSEFKLSGGGNFSYEMVVMEDEKNKSAAASYGINQVQVNEVASDQMKSRAVYMGLVIIHGDMVERLAEITSAEGLEYKITGAIRKMTGKSDALLSLKNPISVTFYASGDLKGFNIQGFDTVESKVKDVVEKLNVQNYRKLSYSFNDPSLDKSTAAVAAKYGMQKIQWKDERTPDGKFLPAGEGVLSIVLENDGRFQVVPLQIARTIFNRFVVAGTDNLDEKLNNGLSLLLSKHSVVGYLTGHGEKSLENDREGSANLKKYLSGSYELKAVDITKEEIPDAVRTLVINGPTSVLDDEALYVIDQFIMKGGNVLCLVDAFNEVRQQSNSPFGGQPMYIPVNTGLEKFFGEWGITVGKDYVMDKKCYTQRSNQGGSMPLYFIPMIERKTLNHDNPVTAAMKNLIFVKGSSIAINEDVVKRSGLKAEALVSSSNESWKMQGKINLVPYMIQPPAAKDMASFPLAVALEGKFKSVFGGVRPAPADPKKAAEKKDVPLGSQNGIAQSVKTGRVIVIGSSEIAGGQAIDAEGKSPDAIFIANAIDWLGGDDSTPEMRTKGLEFNPIENTDDATRLLIKAFNIVLLPILVIVAGIIVWRRRIVRRNSIREKFSKVNSHE
jgi:ABC-type uncharacterized transport system involved in gliding motility auxiliary subunit